MFKISGFLPQTQSPQAKLRDISSVVLPSQTPGFSIPQSTTTDNKNTLTDVLKPSGGLIFDTGTNIARNLNRLYFRFLKAGFFPLFRLKSPKQAGARTTLVLVDYFVMQLNQVFPSSMTFSYLKQNNI